MAEEAREHLEKEIGEDLLLKIYPMLPELVPKLNKADDFNLRYECMS